MVNQTDLFYRFGVALFIGILVGLQREYAHDADRQGESETFAGVRTFALLGIFGCAAALVADTLESPLVFVGIFVAVTFLIAIAYFTVSKRGGIGMTTEVAALLTIITGALCYWDQLALAVAIGVVMTALLSLKLELHGFVARLTRDDMIAVLKFAIITAIILPILPNQSYGPPPLDVLNPYNIWLMVILISAISFLGYVLFKILGPRRGIGLTGLLGGLASSTATTLSFSQRSQKSGRLAKPFALAIMIAWTIMFVRVMVEIGAVHMPLLRVTWLPLTAAAVIGLGFCVYYFLAPRADDEEDVQIANPFELRPAITFGLLYGLILLVSRAAQLYLGDTGLYISSFASGLADVDAITLSMADLSRNESVGLSTAARAIIIAVIANTLVKGGIVISSGSPQIRKVILPGTIALLLAGIIAVILI